MVAARTARVERVLSVLPTAVLVFTGEGLIYANPAARDVFGLGEGVGLTPMEALGAGGLEEAVLEARSSQRTVEVEVQRADRQLQGRVTPTGEGEVVLAVTDLTELRRVEAMRRDFVTNASHELKTPVAGIQALSESLALAMDRDPARARVMIGRLQQESLRLSRLVRELLDLARLEEPSGDERWVPVDLARMARRYMERIRPAAGRRGIALTIETQGETTVTGLVQDLRLIVTNLLDNAVRYNRDGGEVRVRVERSVDDVLLEVADTGVGIPEEHLSRIFERFYRVDEGRSRQAGGTGLGLSIVRNAVQRHGGSVEVDSVAGQGSTFRVRLPVGHIR